MAKKSASQTNAEIEYLKSIGVPFDIDKKGNVVRKKIVEQPKEEKKSINTLGEGKDFGIYIMGINKAKPLIHMEDKQIIQILLREYSISLSNITRPEMIAETVKIKDYLTERNMDCGVCKFSRIVVGVNITSRDFVTDNVVMSKNEVVSRAYWYLTPGFAWTSKDLIECISFRVNKLQEILNSME